MAHRLSSPGSSLPVTDKREPVLHQDYFFVLWNNSLPAPG